MAKTAQSTRYRAGHRFGQYEIRRFIRRGGMAEVYEAEHVGLRKRVAIKVLRAEASENERMRKRFLREGERAARVDHPGIVDVTDVGEVDGTPFLVMELLDGEPLGDRLAVVGRLEPLEAIEMMLPVLAAVWAGHRQGVVHRDLKPDNIFLAEVGQHRIAPKVLDFGISRLVDEEETRLTLPETVVGTPAYLAPEQARGEDADEAADQYALAAVLYRALVGALPRRGDTVLKQLTSAALGEVIPPSHRLSGIDPRLERVLLTALSSYPEERFEDVGAFARALLPFGTDVTRELWSREFGAVEGVSLGSARSGERLTAPTDDWGLPRLDESADAPELDAWAPPEVAKAPSPPAPVVGEASSTKDSEEDTLPPTHRSSTLGVEDTQLDREPETIPSSSSKRSPWLVAFVVVLIGLVVWFVYRSDPEARTSSPPEEYVVSLQVEPAGAAIEFDGESFGTGTLILALPKDGTTHTVVARMDGYEDARLSFRDAAPPSPLRLSRRPAANREEATPRSMGATSARAARPPDTAAAEEATRPAATSVSPRESVAQPAWPEPGTDNINPWRH